MYDIWHLIYDSDITWCNIWRPTDKIHVVKSSTCDASRCVEGNAPRDVAVVAPYTYRWW